MSENKNSTENINTRLQTVINTGVLETKYGTLQVWDPEFWKNPSVWKTPDGNFVPTKSVISIAVSAALVAGTGLGTGLNMGLNIFENARILVETLDDPRISDLSKVMTTEALKIKNMIGMTLFGVFSGSTFTNIQESLKWHGLSKLDLERSGTIQTSQAEMIMLHGDDELELNVAKTIYTREKINQFLISSRDRRNA